MAISPHSGMILCTKPHSLIYCQVISIHKVLPCYKYQSFQTSTIMFQAVDISNKLMIVTEGYRIRPSRDALSEAEVSRLKALEDDDAVPKSIIRLDIATLFRGLRDQLEVWPLFFRSKEECGTDMQQGLVTLWSNFMIAVNLMHHSFQITNCLSCK